MYGLCSRRPRGKVHIVLKKLIIVRAPAGINKDLVIRIKIPHQVTAYAIVIEYRPIQMIFLKEGHFLHWHKTVESCAKPFAVCAVPYCEIGNTNGKEKENQQRKDQLPYREYASVSTGESADRKKRRKRQWGKSNLPGLSPSLSSIKRNWLSAKQNHMISS